MGDVIIESGGWTITNERHNASPLLGFLPLFASMTIDIGAYLGEEFEMEALVEFSNRHVRMAARESQWEEAGLLTVERLMSSDFVDWITAGLVQETLNLNGLGDDLCGTDYARLSNQELAGLFEKAIGTLRKFIVFNNFINASDFHHEILTKRILGSLRISLGQDASVTASEAYSILTTPQKTVWIQEEEVDLLNILAVVQADAHLSALVRSRDSAAFFWNIDDAVRLAFQEHERKYFWIRYEQEGDALTVEHFFEIIVRMMDEGIDAREALSNVQLRRNRARQRFDETQAAISLNNDAGHLLDVSRKFVYWKLHLREVKVRFYCCMDGLMDEIAGRLGLDRYQVRHLMVEELAGALRGEVEVDGESMNRRIEYCVFHFSAGQTVVYEGQRARDLFSVVSDTDVSATKVVTGVCAFPGVIEGRVTQVLDVENGDRFPRGDVLVAYMTDVGVVPAMKRARAIVTDVGGVTCHASIIAREFNIPCVIGTKIATKVLLDGYRVEVDATKGIVTVLSKEGTVDPSPEACADEQDEDLINQNFGIPTLKQESSFTEYTRGFERLSMSDVRIAGGKGAALGELVRFGFPVPTGFVILTSVFEEFFFGTDIGLQINELLSGIRDRKTLLQSSQVIQQLIVEMDLSSDFTDEVEAEFSRLNSSFVAVRSSATHEDSISASWAGQLESFLNTTSQDLLLNIRRCWASLFSDRAIVYRAHCGQSAGDIVAAAVVQSMVDSRVSGTAFSIHPVTGDAHSVFIESCIGLGETLVLGRETPSSFLVRKENQVILGKELVRQGTALRRAWKGAGNELYTLSDADIAANTLTDAEALEVSSLVISIEEKFGFPVDVEWAYGGSKLYLLQSRPVTTIRNRG